MKSVKFCLYTWSVSKYKENDSKGKPSGSKDVDCELEHGHSGPHRSGRVTSPNIKARR